MLRWKKPDTKGHQLFNSIYINQKRLFKKKSIETESRWAAAQAGDEDKGNGISLMGIGFPSGVMEMFESLIKVVIVQYYECY